MTNPWDVLLPDGAERDPDVLYTSIGRALSAWESMEQQFSYLFGFFCVGKGGSDDAIPAKRAYGSVITFRGRSDMLRAAAEAYFMTFPDHKMKPKLIAHLNLAGNFSPRRNEIAHGEVSHVYFDYDDGEEPQSASIEKSLRAMRWLLVPPEYATNKHTPDTLNGEAIRRRKYAYSSKEVTHYRTEFEKLRHEIWNLIMEWSDEYPEAEILPPI